jgi:GDP-mannose 6-dehydrogenase
VLEPGLDALVRGEVEAKRLSASQPTREALSRIDVAIVCVSTPSMPDGSVDVRPLRRALQSLCEAKLREGAPLFVVVRSTVAPNLLRGLWAELEDAGRAHLRLVVNPEFLRETTAIADFDRPPFWLFGADDVDDAHKVAAVFEPFTTNAHFVDIETAMLVKYASNAYHALKIAFANEIGIMADALGADALRVMQIFTDDTVLNVSRAYLRPGFAFGGSCLPKDVRALVSLARDGGQSLPVLEGALRSNAERIEEALRVVVKSGAKRVGLLGLSFKRGTDDLRESPYLLLAEKMVARGLTVRVYDPDVDTKRLVGANLAYLSRNLPDALELLTTSLHDAVDGCDAVVLCKWVADEATVRAALASCPLVVDVERLLQAKGLR